MTGFLCKHKILAFLVPNKKNAQIPVLNKIRAGALWVTFLMLFLSLTQEFCSCQIESQSLLSSKRILSVSGYNLIFQWCEEQLNT